MFYTISQHLCSDFSIKWNNWPVISTAFIFILREIIKSRNKLNSQKILNKNELSKVVILLAIFINLWPIVPSGNFFNNWISMYFFYPVGFYLFFEHFNEKKVN